MQISWKILNLKRQPLTCITILPAMHITSSKMIPGGYNKITISDWSLKPKKPTYLMFFWAALFLLTPKTIADWEYWNKLLPDFTSMISLPSSVYSFFTLQTTLFNLQTPYAHKLIPKQVSSLSFFLPVHLPRLSCAPVTGNHSLVFKCSLVPMLLAYLLLFPCLGKSQFFFSVQTNLLWELSS